MTGMSVAESYNKLVGIPKELSNNDSRPSLKNCFKNYLFSLVPYEIWRDILSNADSKSVVRLCQTCKGFNRAATNLQNSLLDLAKEHRKEDQIALASNCLQKSADFGNKTAMFYLGIAKLDGGWGFEKDAEKCGEWLKISAEGGNGSAMAIYAFLLLGQDAELSKSWQAKALSSNSSFAVAYWNLVQVKKEIDEKGAEKMKNEMKVAFELCQTSANDGDEFGQELLGSCFLQGFGVEKCEEEGYKWIKKAAEQGSATSQMMVGCLHVDGIPGIACQKSKELALLWLTKSSNQNLSNAKGALEELKQRAEQIFN